jgi:hypothetical protein
MDRMPIMVLGLFVTSIWARWTGECFTPVWRHCAISRSGRRPPGVCSRGRYAIRSLQAAIGSSTGMNRSSDGFFDEENHQIEFVDVADTP